MASALDLTDGGRSIAHHPDPLLGRCLLHYRVLEQIGHGGMSVVYRGRDERLLRDVAIKVLHPFLAQKAECRARLAREARAVARLEHPHIVKVFDSSQEGLASQEAPGSQRSSEEPVAAAEARASEGFIVVELVRGQTLKRFVETHRFWRCPELGALVVWQLLQALQHAHDHGVVHRDLKPENVMVRDDGVLKLMDFGIAQVADQNALTITGTLLGSPAHMAPECIDGQPADERSDLFAMGTILYWITTGVLPFDAPTPHALLKQIVDGRVVPAQQRSPRVSDDLARIIQRSLATRPADRFASARTFADALGEALEKAGVHVESAFLTATLAHPEEELAPTCGRVRRAFLQRAQALLAEGATARALATLNRVLADDADDADARLLLEKVQGNDEALDIQQVPLDEASPTEVQSKTSSALAVIASAPTPPTAQVMPFAPTQPPASMPARRWQRVLVAVAAVALVSLSVVVARAVDEAATKRSSPRVVDEAFPESEPGDAVTTETVADAHEPLDAPTRPDNDVAKLQKRERLLPSRAELLRRPPLVQPPMKLAPPVRLATRPVTFRISPWADVLVDGVVLARNQQVFRTDVTVGHHVVAFSNPRAKDHEFKLDVLPTGPEPVVTVRLEPRPALLSVRSNEPDALVDVGGVGGVAAGETLARPLVVPLEQSRQEREVFLYKQGFGAYRRRHTFVAGETLRIDVVLEPDSGDAAERP